MQVISTLPDDYSGFNGTAAIRLSKDGKFLYASNRGHDSIAVYSILADGSLELLEIVPTNGKIHVILICRLTKNSLSLFTRILIMRLSLSAILKLVDWQNSLMNFRFLKQSA